MKANKEALEAILSLNKLTNDDKLLVIKKLISKKILIKWSALCAQSVLHIYENKYPNDKRVRDCIEYLLLGNSDRKILLKHRKAASAAAAHATDYSASYAASAAEAAATYTDADAAYAASYAADAISASVAYASVASAKKAQWIKNYNILISLVEG